MRFHEYQRKEFRLAIRGSPSKLPAAASPFVVSLTNVEKLWPYHQPAIAKPAAPATTMFTIRLAEREASEARTATITATRPGSAIESAKFHLVSMPSPQAAPKSTEKRRSSKASARTRR